MRRLAFWLLLLTAFTVPWEYLVRVNEASMAGRASGVLLAGAWLLSAAIAGHVRRPGAIHVMMAAYVLWAALSTLWALEPGLSLLQVQTNVQLLLLAFIVWDLLDSERDLRLVLQAYVLGAWVCLLVLLHAFATGDAQRRFTVGEFNQNTLGLMLSLALPLAWHLASSARAHADPTVALRLSNLAFIPIATFGILLTSSRSSLLGALLSFGYMLLSLGRVRWSTRIAGVVVAVALAAWGWQFVPERSIERYEGTTSEVSQGDWNGRLPVWEEGLRMISENPLLGVGARNFTVGAVENGAAPHNLAIALLSELGLVGFALYAGILGIAAVVALRQSGNAAMWTTLLAVWLVNAITHNYEDKKVTWMIFGLIAASDGLRRVVALRRPAPALHPVVAGGS
jgi:O-antigen ligase